MGEGVGCAYAYAVYFIHGIIGLDKACGFGIKFVEIIGELAVFSCLDRRTCNHFASGVHQAEHCVCAADVDTQYVWFHGTVT